MSSKVDFLYLSEKDMIQAGVMDMEKCVETMDEMFQLVDKGDYLMGGPSENQHGLSIYFPVEQRFPNMPAKAPERRFMAMVAYLGGRFNIFGEKWYGSNLDNLKKGLPRSILTVMLNDPITSAPLALMSGNLLSSMRTGAVPGVGAKYLADKNSEVLGIIGAGVVNKAALMSFAVTLPKLKKVKVYDVLPEKGAAYSKTMGEQLGLNVFPVGSMEEAFRDSDVVHVAANYGKNVPTIKNDWLKERMTLILSSSFKCEDDLLLNSNIVFDEYKMHEAWVKEDDEFPPNDMRRYCLPTFKIIDYIKEGKLKRDDVVSLGSVVCGYKFRGEKSSKRTLIYTYGMPVEDLAWGYQIYLNALEKGIGQKLNLWFFLK